MNTSSPLESTIVVNPSADSGLPGARLRRLSIRCHENEIPPFADAALQQLYGNLFSSLAYSKVFGGAENASTYVVRDGEEIVCVWLFRHEGNLVRVINEGIRPERDEVMRFANTIFANYPSAHMIAFHAIQAQRWQLPYPYQRYNCLEDMVLQMPRTAADYLASLGKSTRSYVNRYLNKLKRDFPSFRFQAFDAAQIQPQQVQEIIELNRSRMHGKGKVSINDEKMAQRILRLAEQCGFIGAIMIDGRICAGTINYRVGDNYFLEVLAHNPVYNDYRVGTLCCYLTICECITRGGNEYHFLWGQDDYKSRLLGVQRDLDHVVLYRSRLYALRHAGEVVRNLSNAWERKVRVRMRQARRENGFLARLVSAVVLGVKSLR
ncbi:MAG TPA: GNAT family N-acetyltransferase [Noviherbaspirillum sp.]|nr:GNAT family N-acetyltransferase [Noviherbaspirillum sp.]